MTDSIIYEQPLSDVFRACLRLEHLFACLESHQMHNTVPATRNIITTIIYIMQLLERPDFKAKLCKELSNAAKYLLRLQEFQEADPHKINDTVAQLELMIQHFLTSSGKIAQNLKEIDLLNTLRLHLMTPGAGLNFDVPLYHCWLHNPTANRTQDIKIWLSEFDRIRTAVSLLLKIIRESSKMHPKLAQRGFYQELLDAQRRWSLIRITLLATTPAYPEISIGRHFISVRFFHLEVTKRATPFQGEIDFHLGYCGYNG